MERKITNRTVEFIENGSVSTHAIFEDENGQEWTPEPGTSGKWYRVEDFSKGKTIHDRAAFYANARRAGNVLSPQAQAAEAQAKKAAALAGTSPKQRATPLPSSSTPKFS
jgi:hypothetical protein